MLLLRSTQGIPLDVSLGALPFKEKAVSSARLEEIDIEGIVAKSSARIDWDEVRADLTPLLELKAEDAALRQLQEVLSCDSA